MPAQLARPAEPPTAALDAFFTEVFPGPPRALLLLSRGYLAAQALMMMGVRAAEGQEAFLEGAVARGFQVVLLMLALPMAMAAARAGGAIDEGALALAELRGFEPAKARARAGQAPLRALLRQLLPSLAALGAWPLFLSLSDDPVRFAARAGVVALLVLLSGGAAAALLGLGILLGKRLPRGRAPWALVGLLLLPWALAGVADLPREASLPGLFRSLIDLLLGLAPA